MEVIDFCMIQVIRLFFLKHIDRAVVARASSCVKLFILQSSTDEKLAEKVTCMTRNIS